MKIVGKKFNQSGSTLLLTLVATAIIGFTLAAYLTLVKGQNMSGMRSQAWNATIPVIEAGMEDALMHLNTHGSTNLLCDGWVKIDDHYIMQREVGENYYNVCIYNYVPGATNQAPIIESRGFVIPPVLVASANGPMFATIPGTPAGYLGRGVIANARQDFMFTKGLVAKGYIDLKGNSIRSDSFDSKDPAASNNGKYDVTKAKGNGDIATNLALTNSVNVGIAEIYGHVSTGPNGSVYVKNQGVNGGYVGPLPKAGNGIQDGYVTDDMNVDFPDVKTNFTSGFFPPNSGTYNGTNYDYLLSGTSNYKVSSLSMNNQNMMVTGDVSLYVEGDFSLSGLSSIIIAPGAKMQIYVQGSVDLGGNGIINNNDASKFLLWGMPTCTSISYSGNSTFVGCIYAPNADLTMNGSGNTVYDFVGAGVAKTITMNGHFNFHYDEALSKYGPNRGYILSSWNEMTPAQVANIILP